MDFDRIILKSAVVTDPNYHERIKPKRGFIPQRNAPVENKEERKR
jgi:hypothetical protein